MSRAELGRTDFAVVDLETTGIYAGGSDRVIEVGLVRLSPTFEVIGELDTLVNPRRDLGRADIHGISAADVLAAPSFEEVGGDLAELLATAIVVGHHLRFDLAFLRSEYRRAGSELPEVAGVCTLQLAYELAALPSRSLQRCCVDAGIRPTGEHAAIEDARATSALLHEYLRRAAARGADSLADLGCKVVDVLAPSWCGLRRTGTRVSRQQAERHVADRRSFLADLVTRLQLSMSQRPARMTTWRCSTAHSRIEWSRARKRSA